MDFRLCIALIDDDPLVRTSIASLLRSLGHSVTMFPSAEHFLVADPMEFDCLISDVRMPGLSGPGLQRALSASGRSRPLIFMTAFAEERVKQQALQDGALHFLDKPCDPDVMIACLDDVIALRP